MAAYTAIDNPELYFQTKAYTGDGNDDRDIVFDVTDTSLQPNFLWSARRDSGDNLSIYDSVRGDGKELRTAESGAAYDRSDNIQALNSNGFQVGTDSQVNASGGTYVSWAWKESATSGFDIVAFTGTGAAQNISHSLSAKPEFIICKSRSAIGNWYTYHGANTAAPETDFFQLQNTDATADSAAVWNDTAPTTSVFTVGTTFDDGTTYIAYAFASKQGFSKFGSYTGNANADGAFVYTGFRPAFVIMKNTADGGAAWQLFDNKRNTYNQMTGRLFPNSGVAENTDANNNIDFLSNGFKMRTSNGDTNASGSVFIYIAFAEAPLVNSEGVPCNAR